MVDIYYGPRQRGAVIGQGRENGEKVSGSGYHDYCMMGGKDRVGELWMLRGWKGGVVLGETLEPTPPPLPSIVHHGVSKLQCTQENG